MNHLAILTAAPPVSSFYTLVTEIQHCLLRKVSAVHYLLSIHLWFRISRLFIRVTPAAPLRAPSLPALRLQGSVCPAACHCSGPEVWSHSPARVSPLAPSLRDKVLGPPHETLHNPAPPPCPSSPLFAFREETEFLSWPLIRPSESTFLTNWPSDFPASFCSLFCDRPQAEPKFQ